MNRVLAIKPTIVRIGKNSDLKHAFDGWRILIQAAAKEPTSCRELIFAEADYVGYAEAAGTDGCGGVWLSGNTASGKTE